MNTWILAVFAAVTLLLLWKFWTAYRSPEQLRRIAEALHSGGRLIDVRTNMEFSSSHLPGAVNLPLSSLDPAAKELGTKQGPIVVYCASGTRSAHAARMLRGAGFETVLDLGPMFNGRKLPVLESKS